MKRGKSAFQPGRAYPQVDISGYEELEFNTLEQSGDPQKYQNTAEYLGLPASVKVYDGLRHRRLIDLEGQINEKLYVRYKITQDPDLPQETDIYVEYDKFSVYFGKYDAALVNGDMFSLGKGIDGLHADYLDKDFELEAIYGEERSHEREFSFQGSGKREYSLGQTNIVEGTLKIRLNGNELSENDYRVDYFDGIIVFDKILSVLDKIEGTYEYLDPIEDFLPISSKIRLSGVQHRYKAYRGSEPIIITADALYQYEPALNEPVAAPPDALRAATSFAYQDGELNIAVQRGAEQAVYLHYLNERIPLQPAEDTGAWTLTMPLTQGGQEASLDYEFADYTLRQEYRLYLEKPDICDYRVSAGYQVLLPEGVVNFTRDKFTQNETLHFIFRASDSLPEKILVNFQNDAQELQLSNGEFVFDRRLLEETAGVKNFYLIFNHGAADEKARKVPFAVDYAPVETGVLEKIQLADFPVISFTEKVYFEGRLLTANQDYKLNYATGLLTFLRPLPADTYALKVEYVYNQTRAAQEIIKGRDSQGPYALAHSLLVPGSAVIMVNNLNMIEGVDYTLDPRTGALSFPRRINSVDAIQVNYRYFDSLLPAELQKKEQFTISSYYVQEQAKSAEGEGLESHTLSGGDLSVTSSYDAVSQNWLTLITISTKYLPITKFGEVQVDGSKVDILAKSEYNGRLVISGNYTDANRIKVSFDQGQAAQAPQIYFRNNAMLTEIVLDEITSFARPILYGSVVLEVRRKNDPFYIPLVQNRDYIMGRGSDLLSGYAGNGDALVSDNAEVWQRGIITFITGNAYTPYYAYNGFGPDDDFRLTYKISNAESTDPGDVLHQTYGTKFAYSPTDWLRADVEYNESRKRYQRASAQESVTSNGSGYAGQEINILNLLKNRSSAYNSLTNLEIVEDSEKVYINDRLQTKNDGYTLAYNGGVLRFHSGLALSPADIVRVDFSYYSSGVGEQEQFDEKAKAAKVDLRLRLGDTDISAGYVTVDSKYDPVGNQPASYPRGTEAKNIIINSKPLDRLTVYSRLEQQDTLAGVYDDETINRFRSTTYQNYSASYGFNTNDNIALAYNRTDVNEPAPSLTTASYLVDTRQQDYQMDLNVGPDAFRTGVFLRNAESFTDELDKDSPEKTFNRNARLTNFFRPLSNLTFSSSLARNIDEQHKAVFSYSESQAYSELVRYNPWTIDSSFEYAGADYLTEQQAAANTKTIGNDRKQVFNFSFRRPPEFSSKFFEEFYLHYDNTYASTATDLYQQMPNIARQQNFNGTLRPYDIISFSYDDRYNRGLLENHNRTDLYQENVYKFSRFYPTKYIGFLPADFLIVNKVEFTRRTNQNARDLGSGTTRRTYTLDHYNALLQSYALNPLDRLTLNLDFSSKMAERLSETLYQDGGLAAAESVEPEDTQTVKLNYALAEFSFLKNLNYTWQMDLAQRRINRRNTYQDGQVSVNRDDLDSGTSRMNLNYNYFTSFTNTHYLTMLEEFRRNTGDNSGTRYSYGQTDEINVRYDVPNTRLGLTYGFNRVFNKQFDISGEVIGKNTLIDRDYRGRLLRYDDTNRLAADYTPWQELVLDASMYFRHIAQNIQTGRRTPTYSNIHDEIGARSYEVGATYKPLADLSIRYGWRQNIFEQGRGTEERLTAKYTPLNFDFGELSYSYENLYTVGQGTNDPQQNDSLNTLSGFVQTTVVERDDIKVTNTLTFKLNKDISNVIIDNMIVDINLTRLHFWDRENSEYSYSLNAFYAKGTINF
ncbi:hypothetical protein NO1_0485 [Candidatus Termititenax aidoneus]|uniref:Uncharacterized protein n=1 Tax=Termititenax aidoneus TaxID=2218524 RepID=A0A388TBE0_TERA1|nr:hypothetical protein NO1_0485 [Candidatus Termititenax aidoneus]